MTHEARLVKMAAFFAGDDRAACLAGADAHVLLRELVTLVRGECPSVLNEDSGGDGALSYKIDKLLAGAGADALRDVKEIAEAVHYYTGEDVDALVLRYRDEHAPTEPTR